MLSVPKHPVVEFVIYPLRWDHSIVISVFKKLKRRRNLYGVNHCYWKCYSLAQWRTRGVFSIYPIQYRIQLHFLRSIIAAVWYKCMVTTQVLVGDKNSLQHSFPASTLGMSVWGSASRTRGRASSEAFQGRSLGTSWMDINHL